MCEVLSKILLGEDIPSCDVAIANSAPRYSEANDANDEKDFFSNPMFFNCKQKSNHVKWRPGSRN